jgi:hypothetical protein
MNSVLNNSARHIVRPAGVIAVSLLFGLAVRPAAFAQGSLTPPGAPAPTMKSLDQVEARMVVSPAGKGVFANN